MGGRGPLPNAPLKLIRHPARIGHDAQRRRVAGIEAVRGGRHLRQPRCRGGEQLLVLLGYDVGAEVQHAVRVQQSASGACTATAVAVPGCRGHRW